MNQTFTFKVTPLLREALQAALCYVKNVNFSREFDLSQDEVVLTSRQVSLLLEGLQPAIDSQSDHERWDQANAFREVQSYLILECKNQYN
jgi:hypothetical protein